jgi:flap endonuclease-1
MGIKFSSLVERQNIKFEQLEGKTLAIDAPNVIFQFLSSIRQQDGTPLTNKNGQVTSHLIGLFSRVPNLMQKGIKPVFVFDGKPPELKHKTHAIRRAIKEKAREKHETAILEEDYEAQSKYARQLTKLNQEMIDECKQLLQGLGLPVVQAPSEAEAQCAYMAKKKKVWASASQDYDSLLFGAPKLIQNLTLSSKRKLPNGQYKYISPYIIELKQVLDDLQITQDQLIVMGILTGTDFNPGGVKGIGPKKAEKLVTSGKKFETIFEELETNFEWKTIFDIFKNIPTIDVDLKFTKINPEKIKELLVEKHDFKEERVDKRLSELTKKENESLKKWF